MQSKRVGLQDEIAFTGGVANNRFLVEILAERLGRPVRIPEQPEMVGAIGAALHREKQSG